MASEELTLLRQDGRGDLHARNRLASAVYADLERLARAQLRREPGERMPAAALVNDALMRWVLVEQAQARRNQKRGGQLAAVHFDESSLASKLDEEELMAVDELLERLAGVGSADEELERGRRAGPHEGTHRDCRCEGGRGTEPRWQTTQPGATRAVLSELLLGAPRQTTAVTARPATSTLGFDRPAL